MPLVIPSLVYFPSLRDSEFMACISLFLPEEVPRFLTGKVCWLWIHPGFCFVFVCFCLSKSLFPLHFWKVTHWIWSFRLVFFPFSTSNISIHVSLLSWFLKTMKFLSWFLYSCYFFLLVPFKVFFFFFEFLQFKRDA